MGVLLAATGGGGLISAIAVLTSIAESSVAVCGYHNFITDLCYGYHSRYVWYQTETVVLGALLGAGVTYVALGVATVRGLRLPIAAYVLGLAGGLFTAWGFARVAYTAGRIRGLIDGLPSPDLEPALSGVVGGVLAALGALLCWPLTSTSRPVNAARRGTRRNV